MFIRYPLTPFPIVSLGNSFLMYYNIKTDYVTTDRTSNWTSNPENLKYQGSSDSHYLGVYKNGVYDYSVRIPMRVQLPGAYIFSVKILNATHR